MFKSLRFIASAFAAVFAVLLILFIKAVQLTLTGAPFYPLSVWRLSRFIRDKVVHDRITGRSGYILRFEDGSWVMIYALGNKLRWRAGRDGTYHTYEPRIHSSRCTDVTPDNGRGLPGPPEHTTMEQEVGYAINHTAEGASINIGPPHSFDLKFSSPPVMPKWLYRQTMMNDLDHDDQGRLTIAIDWSDE